MLLNKSYYRFYSKRYNWFSFNRMNSILFIALFLFAKSNTHTRTKVSANMIGLLAAVDIEEREPRRGVAVESQEVCASAVCGMLPRTMWQLWTTYGDGLCSLDCVNTSIYEKTFAKRLIPRSLLRIYDAQSRSLCERDHRPRVQVIRRMWLCAPENS